MIDVKELSVGNLIQWLHEESASEVIVTPKVITMLYEYEANPNADEFSRGLWYSPLPITPDRLREAGFVEYPTGRFRLDHFVIDDRDHIYLGSTPLARKGAWNDLQNLVRLISGKVI